MKGKETDNKCSGWQKLKKDLEKVCYDVGNPIICNGSSPVGEIRDDGSRAKCRVSLPRKGGNPSSRGLVIVRRSTLAQM